MQPNLAMAAGASFLVIAPIEEFAKLLAVWIAVYRTQDFREPIDGIIYSATAALGFACIENVIYLCLWARACWYREQRTPRRLT